METLFLLMVTHIVYQSKKKKNLGKVKHCACVSIVMSAVDIKDICQFETVPFDFFYQSNHLTRLCTDTHRITK